jgi:hypothetical protein
VSSGSVVAPLAVVAAIGVGSMGLAAPATAVTVKSFRAQTAAAFAAGTLEGASLDGLGRLRPAQRVARVAAPDEPFVFAAARNGERWVLGTGNAGRVLEVSATGGVRTLFTTPEPEVFAVWVDPDGTVFAGSSPNGKIYRYRDGRSEPWFDPKETYIWALLRASTGELLAATGTDGKLYAIGRDGAGRVLYDAEDVHARSLAALPSGEVLLGTSGEGLVLRIDPKSGSARTVYDASPSEIVGFAVGTGGVLYAGAIDAEVGFTDQPAQRAEGTVQGQGQASSQAQSAGQPTVTVTAGGEEDARAQAAATRSEVYRIAANGLVETVWTSKTDSVLALGWADGRLWFGSGPEGKLWSLVDDTPVMERDFEERQVVAVLPASGVAGTLSFATTNAGGVYRLEPGATAADPTYTSSSLDAGSIARFGSFRWTGLQDAEGSARFSFRSGLSREPDRTWTPWTEWSEARAGADVALDGLAPGRYVQWRVRFAGGADSIALATTELTYRAQNARPRIRRLWVLDPGEILVPSNFNPSNQVFEPAHPDRQGFFTPLEPVTGSDEGRWKTLWKKGYRTVRWEAEDGNQDRLVYRLEFRAEPGSSAWLPMAAELDDAYFGFDETVLPDGWYRFRLRASDAESNPSGEGLESERLSEPVLVDGSAPRLIAARRDGRSLRLEVGDDWNPLRAVEWSVDAKPWEAAPAADRLVDGRRETLVLTPSDEAQLILVRLTDAAFNVVTLDLSSEWRRAR